MGGVNSLVLCRGSALRSEGFGQDRRRPGPMHISQKELQSGAAVVFRIPRIHHGFGEIRTRAFQTSGHDLSCVRAFSLTCDDDDTTVTMAFAVWWARAYLLFSSRPVAARRVRARF